MRNLFLFTLLTLGLSGCNAILPPPLPIKTIQPPVVPPNIIITDLSDTNS